MLELAGLEADGSFSIMLARRVDGVKVKQLKKKEWHIRLELGKNGCPVLVES